jgi:ABC-type uncharacterized transport system permease subunit
MIAIAHFVATTCYIGAAALAAAPFARPVRAPVRWVILLLALGVLAHGAGLAAVARVEGQAPMTGLGPALSFAGFVLAAMLLVVELIAREVSLTLITAPLAALTTVAANLIGTTPNTEPPGARGAGLVAHIAFSFIGIAGLATSAAAGTMYMVQRRELRSRRFGALFRLFPPLQTLDFVNHVALLAAWAGLTAGIAMAVGYSFAYHQLDVPHLAWAFVAWLCVTALALGRLFGGWQAQRAAMASSAAFLTVVALWLAVRVASSEPGRFL